MKTLTKILPAVLFILSIQTFASDTTGCPTMHTENQEVVTAQGNKLQVQTLNAAGPDCSYAKDSKVTLTYSWVQNTDATPRVEFWTKIENTGINLDLTVVANVSCYEISSRPAINNYRCYAKAYIGTGYQRNISVEVAPMIDGKWDTYGYSQNYFFKF